MDRGAPSVTISVLIKSSAAAAAEAAGVVRAPKGPGGSDPSDISVEMSLLPTTTWLTLPLLERLKAFFEPLVGPPGQPSKPAKTSAG